MRRWLFSVRVIVFKGVEDLDSTAVVRMEASMQSAWSVSGSCDDYFVIFNVFKAWGRHKATLLSHLFLEPSDVHVDDRIRTCEYMSQVFPWNDYSGKYYTLQIFFLSFLKQLY